MYASVGARGGREREALRPLDRHRGPGDERPRIRTEKTRHATRLQWGAQIGRLPRGHVDLGLGEVRVLVGDAVVVGPRGQVLEREGPAGIRRGRLDGDVRLRQRDLRSRDERIGRGLVGRVVRGVPVDEPLGLPRLQHDRANDRGRAEAEAGRIADRDRHRIEHRGAGLKEPVDAPRGDVHGVVAGRQDERVRPARRGRGGHVRDPELVVDGEPDPGTGEPFGSWTLPTNVWPG